MVAALQQELSEAFEQIEVLETDVVTNPMQVYIPDANQNPQE
jgi:hypothetical protein